MGALAYMFGTLLAYSPAIVGLIMLHNGVSRWTVAGVAAVMYVTIYGTMFVLLGR